MSTIEVMPAGLTREETEDLKRAIACLEGSSFAQRLTDAIGRPVAILSLDLPIPARRVVAHASERALRGALKFALSTIDLRRPPVAANRAHKFAAAASGALGGAFGLAALPVELPLSTTILLRSIAEIAREEGEDLNAPKAALACIEVFGLGGKAGRGGDVRERLFRGSRGAGEIGHRQRAVCREQGVGSQSAPVVARLISQIAARFGVVVSEKLGRPGSAGHRGDRRRDGQCRFRRPFPDARPRPLHRAAARAGARPEPRRLRISAPPRRTGARARARRPRLRQFRPGSG